MLHFMTCPIFTAQNANNLLDTGFSDNRMLQFLKEINNDQYVYVGLANDTYLAGYYAPSIFIKNTLQLVYVKVYDHGDRAVIISHNQKDKDQMTIEKWYFDIDHNCWALEG